MKTNKFYLLIAAVSTFLFTLPPTRTLAQETIFDRLDKKLGVKLPNEYQTKVREWIDTCGWIVESKDNNTIRDIKKRMQNFTEQFIVEQMKEDWGIDRQNQLLFIWDAIIDKIVGKEIYDGEDGNSKRLQEFEKALDNLEACGEKYKEGIMPLVNEASAEYDRQIAANKQQIAESKQKAIMEIKKSCDAIIIIYDCYLIDPKGVNLEECKKAAKNMIQVCKEAGYNYKEEILPVLRQKVGDEKKIEEMLKLLEIE